MYKLRDFYHKDVFILKYLIKIDIVDNKLLLEKI